MKNLEAELLAFSKREFVTDHDIYRKLLSLSLEYADGDIGYFHLYDEEHGQVRLPIWTDAVLKGCLTDEESHYNLTNAGFWADCIRQKATTVHNHVQTSNEKLNLPPGHVEFAHHISTPIVQDGKIVAVIGLGGNSTPFTKAHSIALEQVASRGWSVASQQVAGRLQKTTAEHQKFDSKPTRDSLFEMIVTIGRAIELRDEYTYRHQENVAYISGRIAATMNLTEEEQFGLYLGASIHDIGKLGIPSLILNKTGKMIPVEMALLKMHPEYGANMFLGSELPWPIHKMILQHHERLDGSGYPNELTQDDICIEARIIAVADTFDAMAADRPYRKAPGREAALAVLIEGRGTLYDPYVVDAFRACLKNDPLLNGENYLER
ncbi:MAG: GAF domain-containing protein [Alphaproteobacteria bacterium]